MLIAATLVVGLMLVMVMMTSLAPVVERSVMDALDLGGRAFSQFSTPQSSGQFRP